MTHVVDVMSVYQEWLNDPMLDPDMKQELVTIADNKQAIEDRFYKELEFGTGGMRGLIGAGTNRMNRFTVGKAIQGLAQMLKASSVNEPSVVIAYDSRHRSDEFAVEAARVLGANGVQAYVFESLRSTPELSFAVRELQAGAGLMITASHNPAEYNGMKVYGSDGGQLIPDDAERLIKYIRSIQSFADIRRQDQAELEAAGLITYVGETLDEAYLQAVARVSPHPEQVQAQGGQLRIVYTPLHGAGNVPVREALRRAGFTDVQVVAEQEKPDGDFPTIASPNPEERAALQLALTQAEHTEADLVIGTDPDCDRMGVLVKAHHGAYVSLSGNQIGALILSYLLKSLKEAGQLPQRGRGALIKTIVTGELGATIAKSYGLTVYDTLTGFKYIGEKMTRFEQTGEAVYLFGYEESYGYLAGTHARDKDGVVASLLIAEAALAAKQQGKTLLDLLSELYDQHGTFVEETHSRTLKGKSGAQKIKALMDQWRTSPPSDIDGIKVVKVADYLTGIDDFPKENAIKYTLEDGSWICLRPSGTEPKIKLYFAVRKNSMNEAELTMERLKQAVYQSLQI